MNKEALLGVGLTEKESEVYLALIELGSSSAGQIIQKTGLHRAVVYDLLERLIEKGLVGNVFKGRHKNCFRRYFKRKTWRMAFSRIWRRNFSFTSCISH